MNTSTEVSHKLPRVTQELLEDKDFVPFVEANRLYMGPITLSKVLGVSLYALEKAVEAARLEPLSRQYIEPRARDILSDVGPIRPGMTVDQWLRGTTIRIPVNQDGLVSITRHFLADDDDEDGGFDIDLLQSDAASDHHNDQHQPA